MVLNKDSHRERSEIPGLDGNRLRKVSFCVDVEVAPCHEDIEARKEARRKRREAKEKEKERLKLLKEDGTPEITNFDGTGADTGPPPTEDGQAKEKTQPGSEARNSSAAPLADEKTGKGTSPPSSGNEGSSESPVPANENSTTDKPPKPHRRAHPKPTTDPLKIYTQCCQLRETPILPEVKEQLLKENCVAVLQSVDLTGYKFQQADAVTFSDFLALVPIKRLILEDCDLTDEIVRIVLSALAAVKPIPGPDESTDKPKPAEDKKEKHHRGVIERLSLKKNPKIGRDGWRYISCFVHMSHSLKAIDLSKITLPPQLPTQQHALGRHSPPKDSLAGDVASIFARSLGERLCGHGLEELVMGYCNMSSGQLKLVLTGIVAGGTKRLGLEGNGLTDDGLAMIGRWMKGTDVGGKGLCEALDLSNNNVQDNIDILSASINELSPLCALSLSNCNLSPGSLSSLLPALATLPHFRWLDLSRNPLLFSAQPDSLTLLRRFLPKMKALRKIDLSNTFMTSDHAIALCEILPEVKQLAFIKLTDNPLIQLTQTKMSEGSMEEGAAVYTALVAAVKVSKTLVRVDVDEPGPDAGDVIHSLSKRLLSYCLRNMEAGATEEDWTIDTAAVSRERSEQKRSPVDLPVSAGDLEEEDRANDEYDEDGTWQDEDSYVVDGTGVVKALGVCLGNKPHSARTNNGLSSTFPSLTRTETGSSFASFGDDGSEAGQEKANEMSKALLRRARNIKARIQPALHKGYSDDTDEMHYRRLLFLDETLYRVIHRFEEEYPECKQPPTISEPPQFPTLNTLASAPAQTNGSSEDQEFENDDSPLSPCTTHIMQPPSRRGSEVSLHSKYLQDEEGQMHKLGQYMKAEIFTDSPSVDDAVLIEDYLEEEVAARKAHRERILQAVEGLDGEEFKRRIMEEEGGVDEYILKIGREKKTMARRSKDAAGGVGGAAGGGGGIVLNTPEPLRGEFVR